MRWKVFTVIAVMLICSAPLQARINKIVIDDTVSPAFCKGTSCASFGDAGQYEQISGRALLEERYSDHAGYVAAVRNAAANAVAQKFLLQKDADVLIAAADASRVLK